ncbi:hypothetical protein L484_003790 [Morus notabilis]|uniref:Uncharacterized protein n=1 Tax=Morus notabilis TaxID=981085 RepID=W9R6P9_9ROSA|nr:hypothetical protein L484_003790 [Morus notabilis]
MKKTGRRSPRNHRGVRRNLKAHRVFLLTCPDLLTTASQVQNREVDLLARLEPRSATQYDTGIVNESSSR